MVESLLVLVSQIVGVLIGIWLILALLGLKWRWLRGWRQVYGKLLKTIVIATATWLWVSPRIQHEGIGQVAQSRLLYGGEIYPEEEDPWD